MRPALVCPAEHAGQIALRTVFVLLGYATDVLLQQRTRFCCMYTRRMTNRFRKCHLLYSTNCTDTHSDPRSPLATRATYHTRIERGCLPATLTAVSLRTSERVSAARADASSRSKMKFVARRPDLCVLYPGQGLESEQGWAGHACAHVRGSAPPRQSGQTPTWLLANKRKGDRTTGSVREKSVALHCARLTCPFGLPVCLYARSPVHPPLHLREAHPHLRRGKFEAQEGPPSSCQPFACRTALLVGRPSAAFY